MIKAKHRKWGRTIYNFYMDRLIKKTFNSFFLVNKFPQIPREKGLLITPIHMSWWDGFFADYLTRRFHDKLFHVMMLEEQLKRFWFFTRVGAFSIHPPDKKSVEDTLDYTKDVLNTNDNIVVMFPQGILQLYDKRPIELKKYGIDMLTRGQNNFVIMPLGVKIFYYTEQKPDIAVRFGKILDPNEINKSFEIFTEEFIGNIDLLDKATYERNFLGDIFDTNFNF